MNIAVAQRITLAHPIKGGMEVQADLLNCGFVARGHRVEVITTTHPVSLREVGELNLRTHYLPNSSYRRYTAGWWRASYEKLKQLAQRGCADVLLSQSAGALGYLARARRELGIPVVAIVHMGQAAAIEGQWRGVHSVRGMLALAYTLSQFPRYYWLWCHAARVAEALIAVSDETGRDVVRELGAPPERVHVIPNGVDLRDFRPSAEQRAAVRAELGLDPGRFVAIIAARLLYEKGLHIGLRALAGLPEVTLLIAGAGNYEDRLIQEAHRLGVASRARFLGFIRRESLGRYLAAADAFVMPSLYREGLPMAIIEAMACGLPVVASRVGGNSMAVVPERTGLLVPPGDWAALAQGLRRLAHEPGWRADLGAAARLEAQRRFSAERMVEDTLAVLESAVAGARERRG